jgi:uncharacterized protein YcfL
MKPALLALALVVLAGCASPAPHPAAPAPDAGKIPDKRVSVDPALRGILQINRVAQDTTVAPGYLEFQVNVQNLTASAITVVYEVDWLDKDGVSLGISMEQPPCFLFAHENHPITLAAPAASARDFRVTFRPRAR